jgi:hypothetical protein
VAHLTRERLSPQVSSDELKACIAQLEAEAKKGDPFVAPVFMMSHTVSRREAWLMHCAEPLAASLRLTSTGRIWVSSSQHVARGLS